MAMFEQLFEDLKRHSESNGVSVRSKSMPDEIPGEFDGPTITINSEHDVESRSYYLAHSFGSIVGWSVDFEGARATYSELRAAKKTKDRDPARLDRALRGFADFEERASEYAVSVLGVLNYGHVIPAYTVFFRADLESMLLFHREGEAPVWKEFFPHFAAQVRSGERKIAPYRPRQVPPFRPVKIEKQQVVQEND
jgi:hypothetical protein